MKVAEKMVAIAMAFGLAGASSVNAEPSEGTTTGVWIGDPVPTDDEGVVLSRKFSVEAGWAKAMAGDRFGSGLVVAVGNEGRIFRWNGKPWDWEEISGPSTAKKIFVGGTDIYRLLENDRLEKYQGYDRWEDRGVLPHDVEALPPIVAVSPLGELYCLTGDRSEVRKWDESQARWFQIGAPARFIAAGQSGLYALGEAGNDSVWHYDSSLGSWSKLFDFNALIPTDEFDYWEHITLTVTKDEVPPMVGVPDDYWKKYESLWIRFPLHHLHGHEVWRYEFAKQNVTERDGIPDYQADGGDSQRGSTTIVSFKGHNYVYEMNRSSIYPWMGYMPIIKVGRNEYIEEYVDNGIEPLVMISDGTIYMDSGELVK